MITKDSIEPGNRLAASLVEELYDAISGGSTDFLRDHKRFQEDITRAVEILEKML